MDEESVPELFIRVPMAQELRRNGHQGNGKNGYQGNGNQEHTIATGGGTFDTLHAGHQEYLRLAFEYADRVLLYVTSDEYVKPKKNYKVKSYSLRVKLLENFINNKLGINRDRYEIRQLNTLAQVRNDLLKEDIHIALVVPEYYSLLRRINKERMDNGRTGILILVKERTRDHKNGDLSSTEIHRRLLEQQHSSNGHMKSRMPAYALK